MKKYILIIITILLLSGCSLYDEYKMPKKVVLKTKDKTYEVYSEHKIKDLIKEKNVEILNIKDKVNTKKTGKHTVTIRYKYKLLKYKKDVSYTVVDTEKPTLLYAPKSHTYYINDNPDFCSETIVIDNYDRNIKCKISGDYDMSKETDTTLSYVFKDDSGNEITEDFNLYVIDPDLISEDNEEEEIIDDSVNEEDQQGIKFSDAINNFKNENTMLGIDISRWQGDVDFEKVKKAGCEFVIMRMAVSNGKDDKIGLDSYYKKNIKKAKKAGLKVGVYVYTAASSVKEIQEQAKFVKKELKNTKLDFPIAYDFESWDDLKDLKLNKYDLMNMVDNFYDIINKDGYDVMIYGSKYYLEKAWNNKKYPTWLAHYTDQTSYEGDYILWQHASDGLIDGIDGYVDIDIYYKK